MERVLAMRPLIAAGALAVLAACGNAGGPNKTGDILKAAVERMRGGEDAAGAQATGPSARLSRAQVEAAGVAMVRLRSLDQAGRSTFAAQAVNGAYVSYISRFGQMVTLNGSLITGSRGIGTDLLSLAPDPNDPLTRPTPLGDWPSAITRTYRFPGSGPGGRAISVSCTYVPGQEREMEIVEIVHKGRQIEENCTDGETVAFTNTHFADLQSGRVWRSVQWLGATQGFVDLEVIEPFTGN